MGAFAIVIDYCYAESFSGSFFIDMFVVSCSSLFQLSSQGQTAASASLVYFSVYDNVVMTFHCLYVAVKTMECVLLLFIFYRIESLLGFRQLGYEFVSIWCSHKFILSCRKTLPVEEILTIDIKPGWKKGTKITFPEKGNEQPNEIPADLVFIIDEKPHPIFTREGNDLILTQKISLAQALTGYTVHLTTLDGRSLTIPINSVIHPNYEEVVPREGMPIPKDPSKRGNLRIKFNIKFPTRLTAEQKAGIKKLLSA